MSGQEGDKNLVGKTSTLPPKALVKPSGDGKGAPTTYRAIGQQQMRLMVPGTAQIIQTHLMPQAMLKQVDTSGRTQITALPARSLAQTSITVTRSPTPTSFVPRATNVTGPRATVVSNPRTPTPPTANITTNFVRSTGPTTSRTPSPAATVISPGTTTWMSTVPTGVQMHTAQLIRASINPSPRPQARVITQQNPGTITTSTMTSNVQQVNQGQLIQTQASIGGGQQQPTAQIQQAGGGGQILATLAAVQRPPRQPTATLVYSNMSAGNQPQQFTAQAGQRLTLTAPRQVRPIQLTTNQRLSGANIRTANISIRPPNVPVLTSGNVLTTTLPGNVGGMQGQGQVQQGRTGGNMTTIIQVQQQPRMTLTPVLMNPGANNQGAGNRVTPTSMTTGKVQPSLTITQVGKITQQQNPNVQTSIPQGHHNLTVVSQSQVPQQAGQAITQIVNMNQQQALNQAHQIVTVSQQIIGQNQGIPLSAITSRPSTMPGQGIVRTVTTSAQQSTVSGIVTTATPIAKVVPQQQLDNTQNQGIFIYSRSPNPNVQTVTVNPNTGASNPGGILTLATTNQPLSNIISAVPYSTASSSSVGTGSFAVVTNRGGSIGQIQGIVPASSSNMGSVVVTSSTSNMTNQNPIVVSQPQMITVSNPAQHQQLPPQQQQQHVLIPVTTKLATTSPRPSILRKRDNEGILTAFSQVATSSASTQSPVKGVKNLAPILHAMSSSSSGNVNVISAPSTKLEIVAKDRPLFVSPPTGSPMSDGSTTVSATSSPGVDKQQEEEDEAEEEDDAASLNAMALSMKLQSEVVRLNKAAVEASNSSRDVSPRKKPRKQQGRNENYNDHLKGTQATGNVTNNKENSHPTTSSASSTSNELAVKKPRPCSLLESYKQNWKAAHNHFQRYTDVKPREERRPTVIDLANQPRVTEKVNGWKVYYLSAQMEDLVDMESQIHNKLSMMLDCMETQGQSTEVDRVNDLLKGNMQRSQVIIDGVEDARMQIMKIFDHKAHVSDIIHRCASKRNFKKREKL